MPYPLPPTLTVQSWRANRSMLDHLKQQHGVILQQLQNLANAAEKLDLGVFETVEKEVPNLRKNEDLDALKLRVSSEVPDLKVLQREAENTQKVVAALSPKFVDASNQLKDHYAKMKRELETLKGLPEVGRRLEQALARIDRRKRAVQQAGNVRMEDMRRNADLRKLYVLQASKQQALENVGYYLAYADKPVPQDMSDAKARFNDYIISGCKNQVNVADDITKQLTRLMTAYIRSGAPLVVNDEWKQQWGRIIPDLNQPLLSVLSEMRQLDETIDLFDR